MLRTRYKKKRRVPKGRVQTRFATIMPEDWGRICSLHWTPATRVVIGALFSNSGQGRANEILDSRSRMMQINRIFIKEGLPFRIRLNEPPEAKIRLTGTWLERKWCELHTVV